ncbi:MAG: aquaporin [Agarilytica sp.]
MCKLLDLNSPNHFVAEFMGAFFLVLAGCGAIVVNAELDGVIGHGGVAAAFGLVVMIMIYAVGNISGAHFNPAVTIGFFFAGRFPANRILPFVAAQCSGAIVASLLLKVCFPMNEMLGATMPTFSVLNAFVVELILTFGLMFVILNVSTGHMEKGIMAGVAIGGTVALEALIAGPITGASMNPARSLGPALVSGQLQHLWLYILAPTLGAALAFPTCRLVQGVNCCDHEPNDA